MRFREVGRRDRLGRGSVSKNTNSARGSRATGHGIRCHGKMETPCVRRAPTVGRRCGSPPLRSRRGDAPSDKRGGNAWRSVADVAGHTARASGAFVAASRRGSTVWRVAGGEGACRFRRPFMRRGWVLRDPAWSHGTLRDDLPSRRPLGFAVQNRGEIRPSNHPRRDRDGSDSTQTRRRRTKKAPRTAFRGPLRVAAQLGLEPRQTESESVVLPLHHWAVDKGS